MSRNINHARSILRMIVDGQVADYELTTDQADQANQADTRFVSALEILDFRFLSNQRSNITNGQRSTVNGQRSTDLTPSGNRSHSEI